MIIVYIPCSGEEEARNISEALLEAKLIACANIFPIKSFYMWQGELQDDQEVVLLCKTADRMYEKVKKKVIAMHSYDTPCVMKVKAEANRDYEKWVKGQVK